MNFKHLATVIQRKCDKCGAQKVLHCCIPRSGDWRPETGRTRHRRSDALPRWGKCHSMLLDVSECHRCDIAWFVHKLSISNGLDLKSHSDVTRFREKRILL